MCLILLGWRVHADHPLIVAANRDEFHARPTAVATFFRLHESGLEDELLRPARPALVLLVGGTIGVLIAANVTLVGFLRDDGFNVYCGEGRILS